jgi:oxalate decarboxylase
MNSQFFFSLNKIKPHIKNEAGSLTRVTSKEVPGFVNISFANIKLNPKGSLEPIWHTNAHKLGHCIQGKALVNMRTPTANEVFTVQKGEMFFIPQGYVHRLENIDNEECIINFALNHTNPETMYFSKAVLSISDSVFNSTFNTNAKFCDGLKQSKNADLLKILPNQKNVPHFISNKYKFDIEECSKSISTKGGYLQFGLKNNLQVLDGLGILGFGLNQKGIVEPHWHTNAGELVYIVKGKTRITILSPNGETEILEVNGGEGAFAPASYFHNIENIGSDDVEVIAFFSHAEPDYIGIGEVMGSYSNEVLASVFNVTPGYFDHFNKPTGPLVIVPV